MYGKFAWNFPKHLFFNTEKYQVLYIPAHTARGNPVSCRSRERKQNEHGFLLQITSPSLLWTQVRSSSVLGVALCDECPHAEPAMELAPSSLLDVSGTSQQCPSSCGMSCLHCHSGKPEGQWGHGTAHSWPAARYSFRWVKTTCSGAAWERSSPGCTSAAVPQAMPRWAGAAAASQLCMPGNPHSWNPASSSLEAASPEQHKAAAGMAGAWQSCPWACG